MHKGTSYDGSHNSAKSVVNFEFAAEEICGDNSANEQYYGKEANSYGIRENECALHIIEGVDQQYRYREGDEDREVIIIEQEDVYQLHQEAFYEYGEEVAKSVMSVPRPLGYYKCEDGKRESADNSQNILVGTTHNGEMISEHCRAGNEL